MANVISKIIMDSKGNFTSQYGRDGWAGVTRKARVTFSTIDTVSAIHSDIVDILRSSETIYPWVVHPDITAMFVSDISIADIDASGKIFDVDIDYVRIEGNIGTGDADDPLSYLAVVNTATVQQTQTSYDANGASVIVSYTPTGAAAWTDQPGVWNKDEYLKTKTYTWLKTTNSDAQQDLYLNKCNSSSWTPPEGTAGGIYTWRCTGFSDTKVEDSLYEWTATFVYKPNITVDGVVVKGWESVAHVLDPTTGKPPTTPEPTLVANNGRKVYQDFLTADFNNITFPPGF